MSDNLKALEDLINSTIDPLAGIAGITAAQHNAMLLSFLSKQGKNTGFPQTLYNHVNDLMFYNNVNLNGGKFNDSSLTISIAQFDTYFSDKYDLLAKMAEGSFVMIRDFEGHHGLYKVSSFTITNPPGSGVLQVYHFVCTSMAGNTDYLPSTTEGDSTECMVELYPLGNASGEWLRLDSKLTLGTDISIPADESNFQNRLYYRKETVGSQIRVSCRGYIQTDGIIGVSQLMLTHLDSALNCNDRKIVNVSAYADKAFYKLIVEGATILAAESIPTGKILSIEFDYYITNPSTI